jgi:hypothetical protein
LLGNKDHVRADVGVTGEQGEEVRCLRQGAGRMDDADPEEDRSAQERGEPAQGTLQAEMVRTLVPTSSGR